MTIPANATQKDAAIISKIAVVNEQYCPKTKEQLQVLIKYPEISLDAINTAEITDMSHLFENSKRKEFAGINTWDTSKVTDMSYMFSGCERFNEELGAEIPATSLVGKLLKRASKSRFDTSNVVNMSHMFEGCVDFNKPLKLNTAKCQDFSCFLKKCKDFNSVIELDTRAAVNMNRMFEACVKFNQALNLDTKNVKNMSYMFRHCRAFNQALNFDTSACENFNAFLVSCTQFNQPLKFDTSKAKKLNLMFEKCVNLDCQMEFDLSNAQDISRMFSECTRLTKTPVLKNLDNVTKAEDVFKKCDKLSNVPDMSAYHKADSRISKSSSKDKKYHPQDKDELIELINDLSVHLGDIDTSAITDMSNLYDSWDCERTDWSGIGEWDTSNATNMKRMLDGAKTFNEPLNWDTSKVTDMNGMFDGCESFNQPLNFDTSNVEDMQYMLRDCKKFDQKIEFDFSSLKDNYAEDMFKDVTKMNASKVNIDISNILKLSDSGLKGLGAKAVEFGLISVVNGKAKPNSKELLKLLCNDYDYKLSEIDTSLITDMSYLFESSKRTDFSGIGDWDISNVVTMKGMFNCCEEFNEKLNWNTSKVTNMCSMFRYCEKFNQPVAFDTSKVADVSEMFANCNKFNQPINFDLSKATNASSMFNDCSALNQKIKLNTKNVSNMSYMFYRCKSLKTTPELDYSSVENVENIFNDCDEMKDKPDLSKFYPTQPAPEKFAVEEDMKFEITGTTDFKRFVEDSPYFKQYTYGARLIDEEAKSELGDRMNNDDQVEVHSYVEEGECFVCANDADDDTCLGVSVKIGWNDPKYIISPMYIILPEDYFAEFCPDELPGCSKSLNDAKDSVGYVVSCVYHNRGTVSYELSYELKNLKELESARFALFGSCVEELQNTTGAWGLSADVTYPMTLMYLSDENFKKLAIELAGGDEKVAQEKCKEIIGCEIEKVKVEDFADVLTNIAQECLSGEETRRFKGSMDGYGFEFDPDSLADGGYYACAMFDKNRTRIGLSRYMSDFDLADEFSSAVIYGECDNNDDEYED